MKPLSKNLLAFATFALLGVSVGCSNKMPENASALASLSSNRDLAGTVTIVENQQPAEEQKQKLLAAKEELFKRLSGRLMKAMADGGPAAAIEVCQKEAVQIAKTVSEQHGLEIGRTGVRLRNPNNQAPKWASELVTAKSETPTFAVLTNGHTTAFLPIKLQPQCLMCHGPKELISPDVQSQLSKLFPDDRAIGFKDGELRGWFWVDLPN